MTTHHGTSPEETLNDYLDALAAGRSTPDPGELGPEIPTEAARELRDLARATESTDGGPPAHLWKEIIMTHQSAATLPATGRADDSTFPTRTSADTSGSASLPAPETPRGRSFPLAQSLSLAAAALLIVSIGAAWYFSGLGPGGSGNDGSDSRLAALPALQVATPSASPGATPASEAAASGVFIVEGNAEQAGIEGDVRIATLGEHGLALPLATGETVTIPEITSTDLIAYDGRLLVYREGQPPATIDIGTGEIVHNLPEFQNFGREYGRWYMVPTDDTLTDWTISDIVTGETRLLSEIVDLSDDESVMPFPSVSSLVGDTRVFEVQPGSPGNQGWNPSGPPVAFVLLSGGELDRAMPLPDFPTLLDSTGSPMMIVGDDSRIVAHETRAGDDRIVVVDTETGEQLARYGVDAVGEDPTLAGFLGVGETLVAISEDRVLLLPSAGDEARVAREDLTDIANPLLDPDTATLWATQGDVVMRLDLTSDELTEVATGFVPGELSFTDREETDWVLFQTRDGVTLADAATGEIVSRMKLPGARGGFPAAEAMAPWWFDADGDTVIVGLERQGRDSSGVPGTIRVLSPDHPDGLEVAGPIDELPLADAYLSPDGTTLYAVVHGQTASHSDLWATPLGEQPAWELLAEDVSVVTIVPADGTP